MTFISNLAGARSQATIKVDGNGQVYHKDGQLWAHEAYAVSPLNISDPNGADGPPRMSIAPGHMLIGELIGANGAVTTNQPIPIRGAAEYIIDTVILRKSTATPGAMTGGLFAAPGKAPASVVLPASQKYVGLTGEPYNVLKLAPQEVALRSAPTLYFALLTPNEMPITFDILIYGLVTRPLEI